MEARNGRTCRYCEWLWTALCPFETVFSLSSKLDKRPIDSNACGQFRSLKDVSMFKVRRKIDQKILVQKRETEKIKGSSKRSIEF